MILNNCIFHTAATLYTWKSYPVLKYVQQYYVLGYIGM